MSSSIVQLYENENITTEIDESLFEIMKVGEIIEETDVYGGDGMRNDSSLCTVGVCETIHDGNTNYEGLIRVGMECQYQEQM